MKSNFLKKNIKYLFFVGSLFVFIFYFIFIPEQDRTLINMYSILGTYFSLIGITIAYLQIQNIDEISNQTKKSVDIALTRMNQIFSVSEISKTNKMIQEIQSYLQNEKYEIALIRMKDLKSVLIQIKYNNDLSDHTKKANYTKNLTDLGSDINNLHDHISGQLTKVDFSQINKNLEKIITTLSEFENTLKYKEYDN